MLQRAVSTAYYAMFHALCGSNTDTLIGTVPIGPDIGLWLKIYRTLGHREAKDRLASYRQQNPVLDIQNLSRRVPPALRRTSHLPDRADQGPGPVHRGNVALVTGPQLKLRVTKLSRGRLTTEFR